MDAAAVILAGGRSKRFGPQQKALAILGGVSLIEHVIERLSPQVTSMAISVETRNPLFNTFNLPQIEDPEPGTRGPLPALLSALRWVRESGDTEWLQLAPCDTPFLPKDLVGRLGLHAGTQGAAGCIPRFRGEIHGACGLWNVSLLPAVGAAVGADVRGFKAFLEDHPLPLLDWPEPRSGAPDTPGDPFFNVNTTEQLRRAERALARAAR